MSIRPEPHIHIERLRQAGYPSISGILRAGDFARLGETFLDVRIIQTQRDEAMRALRDFVDWDSLDPKHQEARRVLRSAGHSLGEQS